jgi:hypothetical protein
VLAAAAADDEHFHLCRAFSAVMPRAASAENDACA